jgi:lysophospholipase L1-like esterase
MHPRRKLSFALLLFVAVVLVIEGLAALTFAALTSNKSGPSLKAARRMTAAEIHGRTGVDSDAMRREVDLLYKARVETSPYRWYGMPAGFQGEYFRTDGFGFRIDRDRIESHTKKIAFYGGSTMYSITTRPEHGIPAFIQEALDSDVAQVLNFGVGGYSSSAELALMLETVRRENISVAVFYDGVNEVGRYAESLQDGADAPYLDVLGYPFMDAYQAAARNEVVGSGLLLHYRPRILSLLGMAGVPGFKAYQPSSRLSIDRLVTEDDADIHAERIIAQYVHNVKDAAAIARAHDILPVFFWQPDIYSTKKELTTYETDVRTEHPGMRLLADAVRTRLQKEESLSSYAFFDLSGALDDLAAAPHFFDYCHLSDGGNRRVAEAMMPVLRELLPNGYWRH